MIPNVESIPTAAIPIPYNPKERFSAVKKLLTSKPIAQRYAKIIATPIVMTGTAVEIMPRPRPEMITVAGPVLELSATFCVGRYDCDV